MQISTKTAAQIISEINKVIPYKINIMNHDGLIIASSDTLRIHEIHMGARYLVEHHLEELPVTQDNEYDGGKPGTNLPIVVRNEIVGVIGITGEYEKIRPYAQIIKRMTEILVMDDLLKSEQMRKTYQMNSYLYEWIHSQSSVQEKELYERGLLIGINIRCKRRFLQMKPSHPLFEEQMQVLEQILQQKLYGDHDAFFLRMSSSYLIGVHECSDKEVEAWIQMLHMEIQDKLGCGIYVGIDQKNNKQKLVYEQYKQAKRALRAGIAQEKTIYFYKDISMDIFMEEIASTTKKEFIQKVFRDYEKSELADIIPLLECYYRWNGSIQQASQEMYLHKNTLQNRLNKIKDRTGYDPRSLSDIPLFVMAIHFYRFLETKI
ncbi:CdaR family transcriptional regulator [Amedibacillus sp. YH-ame10]